MDFLDKSKINYCDQCKTGQKCNICFGYKYYIKIGNRTIYWNKSFDYFSIQLDQVKNIIKAIAMFLLFVFFILGLISFFYHIYYLLQVDAVFFNSENWLGFYPFVFWCSMFTNMFLVYKLNKREYKSIRVIKYLNAENGGAINIYNSLDANVKNYIIKACKIAKSNNFNIVLPIHLFLSLFKSESLHLVFARLGIDNSAFEAKALRLMNSYKSEKPLGLSDFDLTMFNAYYIASKSNASYININHVLLALAISNDSILDLFLDSGVTSDQIRNVLEWIRLGDVMRESYESNRSIAIFKPRGDMNKAMTAVATPYLNSFSEDLTALARKGYLSSNVLRQEKMEELYRVIEANNKSALLVGYPGVGKENILKSLANLMVTEDVPLFLQDKRLISLSLARFVSISASEGRIQENFLRLTNEVIRAGNIILIINDIHNMVGVSSQGIENIDLSEMLLDIISQYNIMVIGTTDPKNYIKYLENHPISSVMSKIEIEEPNFNETVQILESKSFSIEYKYKIFFSYQSLERIVKLTNNYIHDMFQPSKAIKIMEEVAVMVKKKKGQNRLITSEDVSELVSEKVNIPLSQVSLSESNKLLHMEELLHKRIVGQDEAVKMISSALRRARAEIRDEKKPITNLLFLGPTGVGKTELAKAVAEIFFGKEDDIIRLDMSEYQENTSIERLIGSEGSQDGGVLTNAIKQNPFSLLLLDEIEKAHPDILNIFLQVMDDGRLTDAMGTTVDFSNCIIIATSNAAAFYLQDQLQKGVDMETIKRDLMEKELRPFFKPEFLNRFNGIVLFKPLTQDEIEQITKLLLDKVAIRLKEKGIEFRPSDESIKKLAQIGFSKQYGARPLKRTIESSVDDALATYLLSGKINRRDTVILDENLSIKIEKAQRL